MKPRTRAGLLAGLLGLSLIRAGWTNPPEPSIGAGTSFTAGSNGYKKLSAYSDFEWKRDMADPYGWMQFDADNYVRQFGFGGGAWKNLRSDTRVKGGLGLTFGHLKDTNRGASSFSLETGIEKDLERPTVGAEYRLTSGSIGGPVYANSGDRNLRDRLRQDAVSRETYTYNELSGYLRLPVEKTRAGLRLALGLPSYSGPIWSEMLSWKFPITEPLSISPAVTFEQGPRSASSVYFSVGLYYYFQ